MIEPRVYRAAFLPALLALVLVAFSLETPPKALPQGLAADALFEGTTAMKTVHDIVSTAPDRAAGTPGDEAVAERVRKTLVSRGFPTTVDRFEDGGKRLVNVIGRRPGTSSKQIVVMAARDSDVRGDAAGTAADTAALLEFARVFEGRASNRTLVLASVDGGTLGDAGAREYLDALENPQNVEAVIVLSSLGAAHADGPVVLDWSDDASRGNVALRSTVVASLKEELGGGSHQEGAFAQSARLTFPVAPGAQGVLNAHGVDAVRISGSGELRPDGDVEVDANRYGALGRSALRAVSALDASKAEPKHGPRAYVAFAGKLLPAWAIELLALTLVLPALIASIDALARARRRREPVARWTIWLASGVLPFALAYGLAQLFVLVGLVDDPPPAPLDPRSTSLDGAAISALVATAFTAALVWVLGRSPVIRRAGSLPDATAPGAACTTSLAFALLVLATTIVNPFAGLLLVVPLHLWMIATLTDVRPGASLALFGLGLLPIAGVILYYLLRFDLDPIHGAWYHFLLVTGGHTSVLTTLCSIALLALTGSVAAILWARARKGAPPPAPRSGRRVPESSAPIFGPGGHVGPGAIGNARSTLGR